LVINKMKHYAMLALKLPVRMIRMCKLCTFRQECL
jgi:hypothetical protein